MTLTASKPALLHVAMQDLYAGKMLLAKRMPALRDAVSDPALVAILESEIVRAGDQAGRLRAAAADLEGPANLWMTGILDDADRDARSHQPGAVLDIALVGALRKAKAAEIVSSDTAVALARDGGQTELLTALAANREEEIACDRALKARLKTLTGD